MLVPPQWIIYNGKSYKMDDLADLRGAPITEPPIYDGNHRYKDDQLWMIDYIDR